MKKNLILLLVTGLALFGIVLGVLSWQQSRERKAQEAWFKAQGKPEEIAKLTQKYSGSSATVLALFDLARASLEQKNFDICEKQYEGIYDKAGRQVFFRVLALHGMAQCSREKRDFKKAAGLFERAAKEPGNLYPVFSRFEAIRSLQLADEPDIAGQYEALLQTKDLSPQLKAAIEEELLWLRIKKS